MRHNKRLAPLLLALAFSCGGDSGTGPRVPAPVVVWPVGVWDYRSVTDYHPTCCFTPYRIEVTGTITVGAATDSSTYSTAYNADTSWGHPTSGAVQRVTQSGTTMESWNGVLWMSRSHNFNISIPDYTATEVNIGNPDLFAGDWARWVYFDEAAPRMLYDSAGSALGYTDCSPDCYEVQELRKR